MSDYFVDVVENEEEPLGPEELLRNGLELYATAKGAPLKIRMTILRGAKRQGHWGQTFDLWIFA